MVVARRLLPIHSAVLMPILSQALTPLGGRLLPMMVLEEGLERLLVPAAMRVQTCSLGVLIQALQAMA